MTPIEELVTPLTVDQARAKIYEGLAAQGVTTTSWKPGSVVRSLIAVVAIILAAFSRVQVTILRSGFLDYAEGPWLTLLAWYVYGVRRREETFAAGSVTLVNNGGGLFELDAGDLIVAASDGRTYRNTEAFTLNPTATLSVNVVSTIGGSAGSALPGEIDSLETVLLNVSVNNPDALVGLDAESDESLRQSARDRLSVLSPNGAPDAYRYVATRAVRADGTPIGVTRVATEAVGDGTVKMIVATATGPVAGDQGDPETDLGAVAKALWEQVVPIAVTLDLESATSTSITYTAEIWVPAASGLDEAAVEAAVETALVNLCSAEPIGGAIAGDSGRLHRSRLDAAVVNAVGATRLVVSAPASDVDIADAEVPVFQALNLTVHFV